MKDADVEVAPPIDATEKSFWERLWPAMACGAGLFSDGYLQSVIGPVNTILSILYPNQYANSSAVSNVTSIAFAGTVLGMLAEVTAKHWPYTDCLLAVCRPARVWLHFRRLESQVDAHGLDCHPLRVRSPRRWFVRRRRSPWHLRRAYCLSFLTRNRYWVRWSEQSCSQLMEV